MTVLNSAEGTALQVMPGQPGLEKKQKPLISNYYLIALNFGSDTGMELNVKLNL
tara:strand:+ start:348 stop:509 length:162 start_codon:yes stop_codon:yes gene_type:complete